MNQIRLSELLSGKALQWPEFFVRNIPNILPFSSRPRRLQDVLFPDRLLYSPWLHEWDKALQLHQFRHYIQAFTSMLAKHYRRKP